MNDHEEPFHPEMVDKYIEQLTKGTPQESSLPTSLGAAELSDATSARLVHDLHDLERHDARRLALIRARLIEHAAPSLTLPPPVFPQERRETERPLHPQRERSARETPPDLNTDEIPALEPVMLHTRGEEQKNERKHLSHWGQVLAAVLLLGVLVGSFVTVLTAAKQRSPGGKVAASATPSPVCQAYPFKQFAAPLPDTDTSSLLGVTTISANDAWAVGVALNTTQAFQPTTLIEHWDGTSWQIVPSPDGPGDTGRLFAVAAASADDVWAVGSYDQTVPSPLVKSLVISATLIEHWDGHQWNVVPDANAMQQHTTLGLLNTVAVVSTDDVWVAGQKISSDGRSTGILIEHWDGQTWHVVLGEGNVAAGASENLTSMQAISATDIWAAGTARQSGLLLHWDGTHWTTVPGPFNGVGKLQVSAVSANDVWVMRMGTTEHMLFLHWNGSQWSTMPDPQFLAPLQSSQAQGTLTMIAAVAPKDIWVVGSVGRGNGPYEMVLAHWNGQRWQQIATPALAVSSQQSSYGLGIAVYAKSQMWIVGTVGNRENSALIEGQRTCP